ncbi:hypothetical protein SR870_21475 [Rhodopseudomonas palustris]|uniref:hypothetical protein n=1 Tax=Rhodopseudomonas palustris TaxID=1076 RepID=UPI002ACD4705|nr:hypothetical protein [Rhodopseudomonas palustris]WQG99214.1 hypothetical protein SR870_21475 [Rhodopseudomonas palustris]
MNSIASTFELEIFDRRRARSNRLAEFLTLYVHHFGPEHRTATNELVEFLSSPVSGQSIVYFGLTYNGTPCGFATFMHYVDGPIGIVDHLVIAPNLRGFGAFFGFCELIAKYLEARRIRVDHVIAEIMLREESVAASIKPAILVRLMRMVGFKVAKAAYWAPDPTILTDRDSCRAALLFWSQPDRDQLSPREFVRLVRLIYETHYGLWYDRTMPPERGEVYRRAATDLLTKISDRALREKKIVLNGMKNLELPFSLDPVPRADTPTLFYIGMIAVPAAVATTVALAQELLVAGMAMGISILLISLFAMNSRLRRMLMEAFRLK